MCGTSVGTIYLLKRAELAVRACIEAALSEFDLTPTQFLMLHRLRSTHDPCAAQMAREIGVRPQSIIQIIRPLERKGLVEREPHPEQRRILRIRLTSAGHERVEDALRVAARVEAELLAAVRDEQISLLQDTLTTLFDTAEKHALHPHSPRKPLKSAARVGMALTKPLRTS